ncbi:MAG: hypothetical protein R3D86_13830 [Emcibacteraceae bacterium]
MFELEEFENDNQIFHFEVEEWRRYKLDNDNVLQISIKYDFRGDYSIPYQTLKATGADMDLYDPNWHQMEEELSNLDWLNLKGVKFIIFIIKNDLQDWDRHFADFHGLLVYFTSIANSWKVRGIHIKVFFSHNHSFFEELKIIEAKKKKLLSSANK